MTRLHYGRREGTNLAKEHPKEYNSFNAAKQRANGTNKRAQRWYEGVEFRFACFYDFLQEIGPKPSPEMQLDRIDNSGHYEPGNVRWVTRKEQNTNRSNVRLITWQGETHSVREWERLQGWPENFLRGRLNRGWSVDQVFSLRQQGPQGHTRQITP